MSQDAKPDRLSEACSKQSEIANNIHELVSELKNIGKWKEGEEATELERAQLKIAKVTMLMETFLKFQQAGIELPDRFKNVLKEGL